MNELIKFIARYLDGMDSTAALCEEFGVSRKTGYKWIQRFNQGGVVALETKSKAPYNSPYKVVGPVAKAIIELRQKHPYWGPKKLKVDLARRYPEMKVPSISGIANVLKRAGLVKKRRRRVRSTKQGTPLQSFDHPNAIWCVDFKGQFWTGDDKCYPLTITDGYSRYIISCEGLKRPSHNFSKPVSEKAFREYGLPKLIRSDNGSPFSSLAPGGLSKLAVWWIRLGIKPERIEPGHPEQNGRHERMHRTLKAETANPPTKTLIGQQRRFNRFVEEYNNERPHEAIDMEVPAELYQTSQRSYPERLPELVYPSHFKVHRTSKVGCIYFRHHYWRISTCLDKELVGLEECENDCWRVYFGPVQGVIDLKRTNGTCNHYSLIRADGRAGNQSRVKI